MGPSNKKEVKKTTNRGSDSYHETPFMKRVLGLIGSFALTFVLLTSAVFAGEKVFFYYTDPAGSPLAMTDDNGNVVYRADYKLFGEEQTITGTIENNEKFVGKEKDKETGLYYFGARYMKAETGRFTSPDPVGPVDPKTSKINEKIIKDPQKLNLYAYAGNNPWKYIDPLGLTWEYSQMSGQLTHVDDQTEARTPVATGYSGHGPGLNNPDMQDIKNVGPIPEGTYKLGPQQTNVTNSGTPNQTTLPASMRLTPDPETDTFGRAGF